MDRILHTPMRYPANYGFVPGCVVRARPIEVLNLEDEHGDAEDARRVILECIARYEASKAA